MPKNKYPNPVKAKSDARARWRHCGMRGSVAMSRAQMQTIVLSETATNKAKQLAMDVSLLLDELAEALKERVNV